MTQEALKLEREMKQLREVYAVQERDGSWEINDYLLGMLNGLELALSIMENRPPQYKIRKALAQPEQEPVAWGVDWGRAGDIPCVSIIKRLPNGGIEVVAVEYAPYTFKEKNGA